MLTEETIHVSSLLDVRETCIWYCDTVLKHVLNFYTLSEQLCRYPILFARFVFRSSSMFLFNVRFVDKLKLLNDRRGRLVPIWSPPRRCVRKHCQERFNSTRLSTGNIYKNFHRIVKQTRIVLVSVSQHPRCRGQYATRETGLPLEGRCPYPIEWISHLRHRGPSACLCSLHAREEQDRGLRHHDQQQTKLVPFPIAVVIFDNLHHFLAFPSAGYPLMEMIRAAGTISVFLGTDSAVSINWKKDTRVCRFSVAYISYYRFSMPAWFRLPLG